MTIIQKKHTNKQTNKITEKNRIIEPARKLSDARDKIINFYEKGIFTYKDKTFKTKEKEESEEELDKNKFFEYIENESEGINYDLFKIYFEFISPTALAKKLFQIKNKKDSNELLNVIKSGIIDLKYEIKKMSKDEKKLKNQIKY